MKKFISIMLLVILCFSTYNAYGNGRRMGINIGLKVGMFSIEDVNSLNIFSIGGVVGYTLPFKNPYFELTLEGDFNLGYFGGDRVGSYTDDESHIRTFGAYVVVSSIPSRDIYFKGKMGVTHETEFELRSYEERVYREMGPSFGIGVGYNAAKNAKMEAEFTTTNSDMKFFSVGLRFIF